MNLQKTLDSIEMMKEQLVIIYVQKEQIGSELELLNSGEIKETKQEKQEAKKELFKTLNKRYVEICDYIAIAISSIQEEVTSTGVDVCSDISVMEHKSEKLTDIYDGYLSSKTSRLIDNLHLEERAEQRERERLEECERLKSEHSSQKQVEKQFEDLSLHQMDKYDLFWKEKQEKTLVLIGPNNIIISKMIS